MRQLKFIKILSKTVIFLIAISFILRMWHIDWGLPEIYDHDGTNHIEAALQVGTGKLEPDGLIHGTFITYTLFVEYGILYILGKIAGIYMSTDDFILSYLNDPTILSVVGRVTIVLLSIGSIIFTYLIAKKLFNERIAIMSALFMAFSPTHFICSTQIKDDMPATFFCALFFYFISLYFLSDNSNFRKNRFFYASGFTLGVAMAAKMTAIPGVITFFVAYLLKELNEYKELKRYFVSLWDRRLIMGILFIFIGFFIFDPFAVINFKKFIAGFLTVKNTYKELSAVSPRIFYFTNHLPNMIGVAPTILFCISVVYFVIKPTRRVVLLLSFPITYYLIFTNSVGLVHHMITTLPFIVILLSFFLDKIYCVINRWDHNKSIIVLSLLVILFITPQALNTVRYLHVLGAVDNRLIAKKWIENNIPFNESFMIEGAAKTMIVMAPRLKENLETLHNDFNYVVSLGGSGKLQKLLINNYKNDEKTYMLHKAHWEIKPDDIDKIKPDYIITSGYLDLDLGELDYWRDEKHYKRRAALYRRINESYRLIKDFKPFPNFTMFFPLSSKDYDELRSINLFSSQMEIIPGPGIKIFKRKI